MSQATVALVGSNNPHYSSWLETLQHCPGIRRLVICQPHETVPTTVNGTDVFYNSVEQMLEVEVLDMALVCMPNNQAPDVARYLLKHGVPVLVEKPVARSADEIAALKDLAATQKVLFSTAFLNRYNPVAQEFKRFSVSGGLGRIVSIEGRMITSSVQRRDPLHWLFSKAVSGGGILHWLGIHTIDLIRYLTDLEYASIDAQVATLSGADIDVEDIASVSFSMSNGALGTLHAGYVLRQGYGDISITIRGTLGEAIWNMWDFDTKGETLVLRSEAPGWESGGSREIKAPLKDAPGYGGAAGIQFVSDFIDSAQAGIPFVTDGKDALAAMEFIEAAYASSATGQRQTLKN